MKETKINQAILNGLLNAVKEYKKSRVDMMNGEKQGDVYTVENKRKKVMEILFFLADELGANN